MWSSPFDSKNKTSKTGNEAQTCHVMRSSDNLYKIYKNRRDQTEKLALDIRGWGENDFLANELKKDTVFYKASNLVCGPTNAGKTAFTSWFILNLLNAHPDKRFLIFIYGTTTQAVNKLLDMQDIFGKKFISRNEEPGLSNVRLATNIEEIKETFDTIETYYKTIEELTANTANIDPMSLGPRVMSKIKESCSERAVEITKKLVNYTDYIFYFDDCISDFLKQGSSGPLKALLTSLQTTNRHWFVTAIYSLQNMRVKSEVFCNNLTNMFLIGTFGETDILDKYTELLKRRFSQPANLTLYNNAIKQIFGSSKYTIQLFSKNFPDTIYWGVLPKEYIDQLKIKDDTRIGLKRNGNDAISQYMNINKRQRIAMPAVPIIRSNPPLPSFQQK